MPDNSVQEQPKQRGRPFVKGQSGNPAGRPRGSRNRPARDLELALQGEGEALIRKAIELALGGDITALRLCLDRLIAPRRDRVVPLALPPIRGVGDLAGAMASIVDAAAHGKISPRDGLGVAKLVEIFLRAIDTREFDSRLSALENAGSPAS